MTKVIQRIMKKKETQLLIEQPFQSMDEWMADHEKKWKGCMFSISRTVWDAALKQKEGQFKVIMFNRRMFCHAMDQNPIFYRDSQQLAYVNLQDVISIYVSLGKVPEDDVTVWLAYQKFPVTLTILSPTPERTMQLFLNKPTDMQPAKIFVTHLKDGTPLYDIVKEGLSELMGSADVKVELEELWRLCLSPDRSGHHRTASFHNHVSLVDGQMKVVVDNISVMHTLDVMRRLMSFFNQPDCIDEEMVDGVQYAAFDQKYRGSFFMILYGISLLNRSRLPAAYMVHPIRNLAHYYERYEKDIPFATSAWFFAWMENSWPRTGVAQQFRPVCSDIRDRIEAVIHGASRMNLAPMLRDMYRKNDHELVLSAFANVLQTLRCALMEPIWHDVKDPVHFCIAIRSTLLRSIVNNVSLSPFCDAWKESLLEAATSLHPTDFTEVNYIDVKCYGAQICQSLWEQHMDVLNGRMPDAHPAWIETLSFVPEYGFRYDLGKSDVSLRTLIIHPSIDCFMAHVDQYSVTEVVLRLFEISHCTLCGTGKKCAHLMHDKLSRCNVDVCDEKVEDLYTFAESSSFTAVDHWLYYLFQRVPDPTLCQQVQTKVPFQTLVHLLCQ